MPRKIKTVSPKANQRSATLPKFRSKLDLCKINTARIRALSAKQLESAMRKVGPIYMLPKKETGFRWMLSAFISHLARERKIPVTERDVLYSERHSFQNLSDDYENMRRRDKFIEERLPDVLEENRRHKKMYASMADDYERRIQQLQQEAGCKISGEELVARDAEREGKPEVAAKLRAQRRRPPTPHKRPAKIR